mmetsp:Transcript_24371/g.37546  ORF Transcript_24371/g.37546 Transcript_24371/m.37546 type:complete len:349 (+) Transcript_24371:328-1374(+)|eukprot:CAMPEP_0195297774 /NCGR_PEP_ID=MMETSP0707-20130614/22145_1 /TAXON_ID=33640 /ORGANISM="Asterionellopsis glacialis, Strain CCMP134" /LENGTH=348 /DNA_ID=CAMNT_0040359677 /DNA_START=217 /DNA_END=1263 /DNA_ORIENTATION=+
MSSTVGLCCAVGSAIFNGSFAALFKTKKMVALNIHPLTFQLYVCCGIFLSSWLVLPFLDKNPSLLQDETVGSTFCFSHHGVLAGFLFVLAVTGSFNAVNEIGIALAQGIWGGGAMVVSYLWGIFIFGEIPTNPPLSLCGLCVLVTGVICIAMSTSIAKHPSIQRCCTKREYYQSIEQSSTTLETTHTIVEVSSSFSSGGRSYIRGVLWACSVGFFGGSILVPLQYVPPQAQGLVFLPSFGIGTMFLSPLVFYAHKFRTGALPPLHAKQALGTGLASGLIWNTGNLLSILAIPSVGYGVAYPIMQCAILVSGMWGIYAFQEITDRKTILVFWGGGAILVLGGALLALSQ